MRQDDIYRRQCYLSLEQNGSFRSKVNVELWFIKMSVQINYLL